MADACGWCDSQMECKCKIKHDSTSTWPINSLTCHPSPVQPTGTLPAGLSCAAPSSPAPSPTRPPFPRRDRVGGEGGGTGASAAAGAAMRLSMQFFRSGFLNLRPAQKHESRQHISTSASIRGDASRGTVRTVDAAAWQTINSTVN